MKIPETKVVNDATNRIIAKASSKLIMSIESVNRK